MTPLEMIKEGVKSKSWALVKAALKEIEEKKITIEPIIDDSVCTTRRSTKKKLSKTEIDDSVCTTGGSTKKKVSKTELNTLKQNPHLKRKNLFYDDGKTTKVGDVPLDSAQQDRKIKYKAPVERTRAEYKEKTAKCSVCNKNVVVSDIEYSFYKNPENEFVCQNCI